MSENRQLLEKIYKFKFPDTFFEFNEFLTPTVKELLDEFEIRLETPIKILNGEFDINQSNPLWSSRYYNDPPEFFTLMGGHIDGLHWGYYIDDPNNPSFPVVSYYSNDAFQLSICGNNIFEALRESLELDYRTYLDYMEDDPDEVEFYQDKIEKIKIMRELVKKHYTKSRKEIGQTYFEKYEAGKRRKIVAPTRDDMGIVIPKNLYKPLTGDDKFQIYNYEPTTAEVEEKFVEAMKLLKDGYPGAALKLGKDLWIYSEDHAEKSYQLLTAAYKFLKRDLLIEMLQVAKEYREHCDSTAVKKKKS